MLFSEEQFKVLNEALTRKVGNLHCPACTTGTKFTLDYREFQDVSFNQDEIGLTLSGKHDAIRCALMVCKNCGYIMKFAIDGVMDNPNFIQ